MTLASDNLNCGVCGTACGSGLVCNGQGACTATCSPTTTLCGSGSSAFCADVTRDDQNCGHCGTACGTGQHCVSSKCVLPDGGVSDGGLVTPDAGTPPVDAGTPPFDGGIGPFLDGGPSCGSFDGGIIGPWQGTLSEYSAGSAGFSEAGPTGAGVFYALLSSTLSRYATTANTWTTMAAPPVSTGSWVSPAWVGQYLYAITNSGGVGVVLRYDTLANTWTTFNPAGMPAVHQNTPTVHDDSGYLYALTTAGNLVKYAIADNAWTTLTTTVGSTSDPVMIFDSCSQLIFVGPTWSGSTVKSVNTVTGATTTVANAPGAVSDAFCTDRSGHIYSAGSSGAAHFYQYTIATNTWLTMPTPPLSSTSVGSCTVAEDHYLYFSPESGNTAMARILLQ